MKETFETQAEAKVRRNELLDASLYTQTKDFEHRYTHLAFEDACRYRAALYAVVDAVTEWPGTIEWPEVPLFESLSAFNAKFVAQDIK